MLPFIKKTLKKIDGGDTHFFETDIRTKTLNHFGFLHKIDGKGGVGI